MQTSAPPPTASLVSFHRISPQTICTTIHGARGLKTTRNFVSYNLPMSYGKRAHRISVVPHADGGNGDKDPNIKYNTEFGYSRKDIIIIGVSLIAAGYILYYGLQAQGMNAGMAGNWVQLIIFLGICVAWIGSYLYRVATKQMTYVKQLEDYEEAVMRKRIEEMPEVELESVLEDVDRERERRRSAK